MREKMRSHKTIWIACLCLAGLIGCDQDDDNPGGEGGMGGSISGAGGGGGEGGNCIEPSVDPDHPMYDRFEGTAVNNACRSDDDCVVSGCSAEICAAEGIPSTCEGLPSTPEGGCGCIEGVCIWNIDSCDPEPCPDVDHDEICDADDSECNADGTPLQCRQAAPPCEPGTVPEIRDNCYSGRCVAWDQCGEPLPCNDADEDGICDERDAICGDNEILCDGPEPLCDRGMVPVAVNGCFTGACTTWDQCGEPACEDTDNDGVCDGRDFECNADGTPLQCRQAPPACEPGTVPEIRNNCYTRRCVTWEQCGEPPCADVDEDGICDERDEVCGDNNVICDALPPLCEAGTIPIALNGCWTGACTTWAKCSEELACDDADGDGTCNNQDGDCNADGTPLQCRRAPPRCERGTVPEIRNGCYTDRCVTWEMCGGGCDDADHDGICDADDRLCESDGSQLQCRRPEPACERGTHPEVRGGCYTDRCLSWEMCAEATAAEGCVVDIDCGDEQSCQNGACVDVACIVPTVSPRDPRHGRYEGIGANNACRQDADCVRSGCSAEICAAEQLASTCEVVPIPEGDCGCVEGVCIWHINNCDPGPAQCAPIRDGEFGFCEAFLGWGISAATGECAPIGGCGCDETCEGRVFPSEQACQRSCDEPVVVEPDHPSR